ncbi:MAG: outer membrane protein assembly factor BamA [Sulfurovum sp.]|nr:outer membrane protein assembly factor BamA [Sulfurovaceae bacterium]
MGKKNIALFCLTAGTLLSAQKITNIQFDGLVHLSPSVAKEVAGIKEGDVVDISQVDESVKNLYSQGYFKDVWVENKNGTLIYHFKEKSAISNLKVTGYGSDDEGETLLAGAGIKKGDMYDKRLIDRAKKSMIAKIESEGYYDTIIEVSKTKINDSYSVVFEVNKGEKIKIKKTNFIGSKQLPKSEIEANLVNKESNSFWSWIPFFGDSDAHVDQLQYDSMRAKEAYMQEGYLDAEISKPLMRVDGGSYNAEVNYMVTEGQQFRVGNMTLAQNVSGLDTAMLMENFKLRKGKIFDVKKMRMDMEYLKNEVGNLGYAYAKVAPNFSKDNKTGIVNLQYQIVQGQKVTINDVLISGNDITKDRVIRRYIYLAPGDLYNATDLKDSKSALGRTGFFEKVDILPERISEDKVNLLVKVTETQTGSISAGGGYGSYQGLMFNASLSNKNLFGTGLSGNLGFDVSEISTSYNMSITNPRIWDSEYSLSGSFFVKDYEYIDYTQDQVGGSLSVGKRFMRHLYASVGVSYIDNQSKLNDGATVVNDFLYMDQYTKTSLLAGVSFDNTDDYYTPREGFIAALNGEFGSFSGDLEPFETRFYNDYAQMSKLNARFGAYYGMEDLIDYDLIMRFKLRGTILNHEDNEKVPTAERLYMGGVGSVRGYSPYSLSPYIIDPQTGDEQRFGGDTRGSGTVEASIPISEAAKVRLTFFADYGKIIANDIKGLEILNDSMTRSSVGAQVEWQSPFGPINLIYAEALDAETEEEKSQFEFSMGTKF